MKTNIGIVIGVIVFFAIVNIFIGFFGVPDFNDRDKINKKDETMIMEEKIEKQAVGSGEMTDKEMLKEKDFDAVIAKAQSIDLLDVSQSGAFGTAWLAVYNGKTYHRVIAKNMPILSGTDFYEGWLVKNPIPGGFVSSGRMEYNPTTKEAYLDYIVDGDMSDYRFVVITSEPDDNNPAPAKHIIEARFPANINLLISSKTIGDDNTMMKTGLYEMYTSEKVMIASATHNVVLFFRASWCPSCRTVDADIKSNLGKIPSNLTILDVNYDDSTDLKKKYGVTYQHTFVQVDKDGNLIKKWSGSSTLSEIVAEVQ